MKNILSLAGASLVGVSFFGFAFLSSYGFADHKMMFGENVFAADVNLNIDNAGVVRDSAGKIKEGIKIDIPGSTSSPSTTTKTIDTEKKETAQAPKNAVDTVVKEDVKAVIASEKNTGSQKKIDTRYTVEKAELIKSTAQDKKDVIRFSGKALPNTLITLYIYSTPKIVVVTADAQGNWSYDMTTDLEDGNHEAYVAVTDATGKVSSYGQGIAFVKTADAITVKPIAEAAQTTVANQSPLERSRFEYIVIAFISMLVFSGIALIIVSRRTSK